MAYKVVKSGKSARSKLFEGVELAANVVTTTLSPKGRNVAIHRQWGSPVVVHDGVTVMRELDSRDPTIKMGIDLIRIAAQRTNEDAGDATTTTTLLAYELVKNGLKMLDDGENPMTLREQIYDQMPVLLKELKRLSTEVKTKEEIANVAFISSADRVIGDLVAEAVEKIGKEGLVTCEEGMGLEHEVEYTEGMQFDKGYLSPYFVTNPSRMEAVIDKPSIIIFPSKLTTLAEIVPILETVVKSTKDMVIIAEGVSGDALYLLSQNKVKGVINVVAVEAPGIGDKTDYFEDIAVLTGGKVLPKQANLEPEVIIASLGKADKFVASKDSSMIVAGKGKMSVVRQRVKDIKKQIEREKSPYEKEKLEARLAKLTTGVAVVKVGAKTELDMREKLERVKDAIGSATSARDEGVIVGGGSVFLHLLKVLDVSTSGGRLLKSILESPIRKIMENSGETEEKIKEVMDKITKSKSEDMGYNCITGKFGNLREQGVIDPTKVVRLALENAVTVGTSILTTDATIAIKLEKADRKPQ